MTFRIDDMVYPKRKQDVLCTLGTGEYVLRRIDPSTALLIREVEHCRGCTYLEAAVCSRQKLTCHLLNDYPTQIVLMSCAVFLKEVRPDDFPS